MSVYGCATGGSEQGDCDSRSLRDEKPLLYKQLTPSAGPEGQGDSRRSGAIREDRRVGEMSSTMRLKYFAT